MERIQPAGPPPENNLVWGILSTIFCCLPLGIVSIIKAAKVNDYWNMGHFDEAIKAAEDAKKWAIYSAITAVAGVIIYVLILLVFGMSSIYMDL